MDKPLGEKDFLRLLEQGLELPPGQRQDWLATLPISAPDKTRLARLLDQMTQAEVNINPTQIRHDWLENPIKPGAEIGSFRILDLIGTGGMGHVYLAERVEGDFDQQVAIKLLNARVVDQELLSLFNNERQILA
ncbi:MAG: hypothetical protein AAF438_21075, partial [Pseudomonadota bacterium]